MFLHILGGADILRNAKLYISPPHSSEYPEIFKVPRSNARDGVPRSPDTPELIPSVINGVDPRKDKEAKRNQMSPMPSGIDEMRERCRRQHEELADAMTQTSPNVTEQATEVVYVVLRDGRDYGEQARIVALVLFMAIFVLTCLGFACVCIEQT